MSYKDPIRSDDPDAVEKLTEKLNKCKERQSWMKEVNAYYRSHGTVRGMPQMTEQMADRLEAAMKVVTWDPMPYPASSSPGRTPALPSPCAAPSAR